MIVTCNMSVSVTSLYMLTWCITQLLPVADEIWFGYGGHGGLDVRPNVGWIDWYILNPLLLVTIVALLTMDSRSSKTLCVTAHIIDLSSRLWRMPFVWDHEQWAMLIELTFVVSVFFDFTEEAFLRTIRRQLAILYSSATFWKFNPSFMNPSTSCGTVVILEFLEAYLPTALFPIIGPWVAPWSATVTLIVEGLIAILILFSDKKACRAAAVAVGCLFHWSIFVMPVNSAGGFSMDCVARYILLFTTEEVTHLLQQWSTTYGALFFVVPAFLMKVRVRPVNESDGCDGNGVCETHALVSKMTQEQDCNFLGLCVLIVLYALLLWKSRSSKEIAEVSAHSGKNGMESKALLWLTFAYAYLFTILGIGQMGAPTMYANLRYYDGGNHYLVPIGILGDAYLHGGGVVKVHRSTSHRLNMRIGHIPSSRMWSNRSLAAMQEWTGMNSTVVQHMSLILTNEPARSYIMDMYTAANPVGSTNSVPFLLPLSTINSDLRAAREAGETYEIALSFAEEGNRSLRVLKSDGSCQHGERPCSPNDSLVQRILDPSLRQGPIEWLIDKILSPYPQLLDGVEEEVCMT